MVAAPLEGIKTPCCKLAGPVVDSAAISPWTAEIPGSALHLQGSVAFNH